jgi:oligopeptide/dipeptide ABC transporter ATP-binding protein
MTAVPLDISRLTVAYRHQRVLDRVDLTMPAGEILGLVGETGSGKTTLARAVVGLAPVSAGRIVVDGTDVTGLRGRALREFRRSGRLRFTFQDPLRALDPQSRVGDIVGEALAVNGIRDRAAAVDRALHRVGLDPTFASRTPGQISGGQRQRVLLARAIVTEPRVLICDEPVSALDASNRNHILRLLDDLRTGLGLTVVVISHDLSSLAGIADRIAVLYRGRLVEQGPTRDVLSDPRHPYTALLTASAPSVRREHRIPLSELRPDPDRPQWTAADGCAFAARCRFATTACTTVPELSTVDDERSVACHHQRRFLCPSSSSVS